MRFYTQQHRHTCGVDLHARSMYLCILDQAGEVLLHKNLKASPQAFLKAVGPFRDDLVVAAECMFAWYWLADLCAEEDIPFVLGHALYMKAIHGGKSKNDKIDAYKIAHLLRGGTLAQAYVYPRKMRSTRDLLRRRLHFVRKRAELLSHIQNTNSQYNLPPIAERIAYKKNRQGLAQRFEEESVQQSIAVNLELITHYDQLIRGLELFIVRHAKRHNANTFHLLKSIPGIGKVLALTILYEIHTIHRFPRVQDFVSYCRLVKCPRSSAGKLHGTGGGKIGNAHLKWAFSEAAALYLRGNPEGQKYLDRLTRRYGKGKALSILAKKIGRAVYYMLVREKSFDEKRFLAA